MDVDILLVVIRGPIMKGYTTSIFRIMTLQGKCDSLLLRNFLSVPDQSLLLPRQGTPCRPVPAHKGYTLPEVESSRSRSSRGEGTTRESVIPLLLRPPISTSLPVCPRSYLLSHSVRLPTPPLPYVHTTEVFPPGLTPCHL